MKHRCCPLFVALLGAFSFPLLAQTAAPAAVLVDQAKSAAHANQNMQAADLFGQAIAADPQRRRELLQEYADQLVYAGRSEAAIPLYREVLQAPASRDEKIRSLKGLGLALLWTDHPTEARPVFESVIREQPNDQDTRRNLARALSWSGRQREAVAYLRAFLAEHPDDREAKVQLAQALVWMGRPDEAQNALSGVTGDGALKLSTELARDRAPRTTIDAQHSTQSDNLNIRGVRLAHSIDFSQGRGTLGARVDRIDYARADGSDSARVTRPMVTGRYRFNDSFELNAEAGRENIQPAAGPSHDPAVYATWLTWWPNDAFRFDLSTNRSTFDNLQSLHMGLTARQTGLSMDYKPAERLRMTARLAHGNYSDGNARRWGQLEGEYRWHNHPDAWIGLQHTRFEFDRLLNNGYFNPMQFESTMVTLRSDWRPDGPDGRWDVGAYAAFGREHAVPGGGKPAYDVSLRTGYRLDAQTRLEARAQRFSSRTSSSGFARTVFGLNLERSW